MPAADRFDRITYAAANSPTQAIPARAACLITKLLREVVHRGHARMLRQADIRAAGKTGTSSATMDTWFIGFTDRWMTVAWLGDDMRIRPLGRRDASYMTALPFWSRYMYAVLNGRGKGDIPVAVPEGVDKDDEGGRRSPQTRRRPGLPDRLIVCCGRSVQLSWVALDRVGVADQHWDRGWV